MVDDALGVALVGARGAVVLEREVRDGQQPAVVALDVREPARQQLELALRHALVEAAVDPVPVDAAVEQRGRHLVRARAGVLVHEAARVGHQADVERLADRRRELHAELLHQVPDHLGRARGCRSTWLSVPKRVLSWWWSMLRIRWSSCLSWSALVRSMLPQSRNTSTRWQRSGGRLGDEPLEVQEAVLVGQRELVGGHERERVLADRGQHELHRGQRADGVAVGALVRGQQEAVGLADRLEQLARASELAPFSELTRAPPSPRAAPAIRRPRSAESS